MRSKLKLAGAVASAAVTMTVALGTDAAAIAQDHLPTLVVAAPETQFTSIPLVQPLPTEQPLQPDTSGSPPEEQAGSLPQLVAQQTQLETLPEQLRCLASAIYFEAKGETLPGQLAVARVIVNRAGSGRFPASYCGVVYQPSQFSFVQGHRMPAIHTGSSAWRQAVAIAQIAVSGSWHSQTEGALYFHAARVTPGWKLTRIARVDDHVFYR